MGKKAEAGTPKAISNAMKVKGLQKLRFYCQLCQKQCRDENGFKCHTMSEGHQRQMMLCADDPSHMLKITSEFSSDFLGGFMRILRLSYNGKRVKANTVYQEYIADKSHTHMNSTRWHTLSGFVQWLGKTGYCKVDFVEEKNQWYIEYVDNSPETLQRNAEKEKLAKSRKDDAEREAAIIQSMVERGKMKELKKGTTTTEESTATELKRNDDDKPIKVTLSKTVEKVTTLKPVVNPLKAIKPTKPDKAKTERKKSALEQIREAEQAQKVRLEEQRKRDLKRLGINPDPEPILPLKKTKKEPVKWIYKKIVVKIMNKNLGEKFYKKKAFIESTDGFTAVVQVIDSGKRAKIDQDDLETVIPSAGRQVVILVGEKRGHIGELVKIDTDKYVAKVELDEETKEYPYEQISKLYQK